MSEEKPKQPQELQITMPQEIQRGSYANQMVVAHTQEEFVLDFILATPPAGVVNARVLVSPGHAKRIATALMENVAKYEAQFGEIKTAAVTMPVGTTAH
jgi:type IV secretory pathway TrbF-like protein